MGQVTGIAATMPGGQTVSREYLAFDAQPPPGKWTSRRLQKDVIIGRKHVRRTGHLSGRHE